MEIVNASHRDGLRWMSSVHVAKYTGIVDGIDADTRALAGPEIYVPEDEIFAEGNLLTTAGLTRITSLITAAGGQGATNTSARIGVGNSSTAALVGDTDLGAAAGAGNRQFEIMAATYPQSAAGVITFRAVFATGEANFVWNEWGIDIGAPTVTVGTTVNATFVNHKIINLGTKTSASAWTFTVTVTLS